MQSCKVYVLIIGSRLQLSTLRISASDYAHCRAHQNLSDCDDGDGRGGKDGGRRGGGDDEAGFANARIDFNAPDVMMVTLADFESYLSM
ncbi:hypothetical protein KIN20_012564 [Parelaphostrongylus tenuis]|uniref:Uncharacterized protein n=1 Tax=Parelaphostrongylus tenuis TaxID=148309 RepID=A0AAD5MUX5_PARTN|nr:hypothetical protein KIN20_012564 [Parelaphostrongylus tenuis]